jgi:hypothetical protein
MLNYLTEWQHSNVDQSLTQLNVIPLENSRPLDYLFYADNLPRRNDGRVTSIWLDQYQHTTEGGWWCSGVDLLTGKEDLWGCFKPETPRYNRDTGKLIKYEHPPKAPAGLFALRIPPHLWVKIAQRYKVSLPFEVEGKESLKDDFAFWQWLIDHPQIPLCITEGAKKAGALLTAGYVAIALPGIYGGYRNLKDQEGNIIGKPQLIPQLEKLTQSGRKIYFVFDQDSKPTTQKAVNTAIQKTGYLLQQVGCEIKVVIWDHHLGKGIDDLITNQGGNFFEELYNNALNFEVWKAQSLFTLTYPRNIELNERYVSNFPNLSIPKSSKLIGIKSGKNTGKTEFLSKIVSQAIENKQKVLVIGHRIKLVEELCERFNLNYLHNTNNKSPELLNGYGLCIDSLHSKSSAKFKPEDWADSLIIIDEVEQVLWHGLNSDTCKHNRVAILKAFKNLINQVFNGKGQVIVADADLSDCSLEYLMNLRGNYGQPFIIENLWKPSLEDSYSAYYYPENSPKRLVKDLITHIEKGGKPFIFLSAQKLTSRWGTLTFEAYLKQTFPDHKILRIDGESLKDNHHPAYNVMGNLNHVLKQYDIVLASPAIETGISVDLKQYFTSVWCIAQGVQSAHSVCQSLGRIRDNIDRYLWVASYGFNKVGNGSTSISNLLNAGHRLTSVNIRLLQQADLEGLDELELNFASESLHCWAKMAVRINATMSNYREAVLAILKAEGQKVEIKSKKTKKKIDLAKFNLDPQQKNDPEYVKNLTYFLSVQQTKKKEKAQNELMSEIQAIRDYNYQNECEVIAKAKLLNFEEYTKLKKTLVKTNEEKYALRKYELQQRYCISVTPELVVKDDHKWYDKLRLHYYLTKGRNYLAQRDAKIAQQLIQQGQGNIFTPDFNHCQLGVMINTLEMLEINQFINQPEKVLKNTDPQLENMAELALKNQTAIKTIFKIGLSVKSTPIMILRRFLDKIGYSLNCLGQERVAKKSIRTYQINTPQDQREKVFQNWLILDQISLGNIQEELRRNENYLLSIAKDLPQENLNYIQLNLSLDLE